MAEMIVVNAVAREGRGRNDSRRLRRQGKIPVTIYGGGDPALAAIAELSDLAAIIRSDSGVNTLFTLAIEGQDEARVIFQDRQIHPVTGRLMHADLRRLAKGEKIEVTIALHLVGEPEGVRTDGGMLEQQLREVRVLCTPSNIPETIDVDVTAMKSGEALHVSDLPTIDEVEYLDDAELMVASVIFLKAPDLDSEAAPEGTVPNLVGDKEGDD